MLVSALGNMVFLFLFYLFSHRHFQLKFQISILSCQCCYCQNIASVCLSGPFYRVCFLFFCPFRISYCPFLAQPPLPIPQVLLSLIAPYVNLGLGILSSTTPSSQYGGFWFFFACAKWGWGEEGMKPIERCGCIAGCVHTFLSQRLYTKWLTVY